MSANDPRLGALYPHLRGADPAGPQGLLESIRGKAAESCRVKERFFAEQGDDILAMAVALADVYAGHGRMFSMGNGGSSCDAAHFAVEFTHPVTVGRPSLPTLHLADDTAFLTAIGNDVGFADIYARRLIALARPGDGVIAFSTSGNSANLARALREGRRSGLATFAVVGGDGGEIRAGGLAEHLLCVASDSIHRVQEVHVALYHVLWDIVHTLLAGRRGAAG